MIKDKIVPVIHIVSEAQAVSNMLLCRRNAISKVMLISHVQGTEYLKDIYLKLKSIFPDNWFGINFLGESSYDAAGIVASMPYSIRPNALWCDNGHLFRIGEDEVAVRINERLKDKDVLHFGGVHFKYQKHISGIDEEWVLKRAVELIDVITTSGAGTGKPASESKIAGLRSKIGNHPLAIASGVDYMNASMFGNYVDYMLVASSITNPVTEEIIEEKLLNLIKI